VTTTAGIGVALRGVAKRVQGRRASRFEALIAAAGTGFAVYRLLRSGSEDDPDLAGENENGEHDDG
jgi:hypothetical protein